MKKKMYANLIGYSDVHPYEIVSKTAKTITIREMDVNPDPTWKPEIIAGGFAGHCVNQSEQRWIITPNTMRIPIKAYLRKDGYFHSRYGRHNISEYPSYFYDYNF